MRFEPAASNPLRTRPDLQALALARALHASSFRELGRIEAVTVRPRWIPRWIPESIGLRNPSHDSEGRFFPIRLAVGCLPA